MFKILIKKDSDFNNELLSDLVYPQKPQEYFTNKKKQQNSEKILVVKEDLFQSIYVKNLEIYKIACLKEKFILFDSDFIQIKGVFSLGNLESKKIGHIILYFTNKSDCKLRIIESIFNGNDSKSIIKKLNFFI